MNLYTNGCSWTWGGSLDEYFFIKTPENLTYGVYSNTERLKYVWPTHLGRLLGATKVTDLSSGCGSNQRIVRTTYDWLKSTPVSEIQETVAVIQIAELSRFEMYNPLNSEMENHPGDWMKCKIDVVNSEPEYNDRQGNKPIPEKELLLETKRRLRYSHHLEDVYRTISYIYALKGMFDAFQIKDYYFWIQNNNWPLMMPEQFVTDIYENFKVLDDNVPMGTCWNYENVSKLDQHPSVKGHRQIARQIHRDMIRKGYQA